ncbi:MAG: hypothetical protein NZ528_10570 [Caldilineales bacterium]|nr:hypothetical protein [Caldilineales bacterium]MDW8319098.1 hypothetical protein [Anaerolineae bacterium]
MGSSPALRSLLRRWLPLLLIPALLVAVGLAAQAGLWDRQADAQRGVDRRGDDLRAADLPALAWQPANVGLPPAQPVVAVAADPSDPRLLVVATTAPPQLYRSADGGLTWRAVGQALGRRQVHTLLAPPDAPGVFLAGTSDGLFRSVDRGLTWQPVADTPQPIAPPQRLARLGRSVYALIAVADGALYLAGEDDRPWRSRDAGATWEPLGAVPLSNLGALLSLAVSPDGRRLLAGSAGDGLFRSEDAGQTWQRVEEIPPTFVAGLWFDPAQGRLAYARTRAGFYRSADGGLRWQLMETELDGRADALLPGPSAAEALLLTNAGQVYATADGGQTWQRRGALGRSGTAYGLWRLAGPEGASLVAATHAGLWRGDAQGDVWQPWPAAPGHPVVHDLIAAADGALYLAAATGVYRSDDSGAAWSRRSDGLPPVGVLSLAAAPSAPQVLYAGTDGRGLYRSDDAGRTWRATALEVPTVPGLWVDPADPDHVLIRAAFQRVYESQDGGRTWTTPWDGLDLSTEIIAVGDDGRQPPTLFASGTEALYRRLPGSLRWEPIGRGLEGQTAFRIVADPERPDRLWAATSTGVYISDDGGVQWLPSGRGLDETTAATLAFASSGPRTIYVGTRQRGMYRSADGGHTWEPAGLDGMSVYRVVVSGDGKWLVALAQQGVWRAALQGGTP